MFLISFLYYDMRPAFVRGHANNINSNLVERAILANVLAIANRARK